MITYRQQWEPGEYQAGKLVSTIPLGPRETRKFSVKRIFKSARSSKSATKTSESRSEQTSTTARAEAEIMQKVSTATNFKLTAHGTFNFSIGSVDTTSDFSINQAQESSSEQEGVS